MTLPEGDRDLLSPYRGPDENKAKPFRGLKGKGEHSVEEICEMLGVGRSTLYRNLGKDDRRTRADDSR